MDKELIAQSIKHWLYQSYGAGEATNPSYNIDALAEYIADSQRPQARIVVEVIHALKDINRSLEASGLAAVTRALIEKQTYKLAGVFGADASDKVLAGTWEV